MADRPANAMVDEVTARVRQALGTDLKSVVVFGSAAEDRLRPTSDVNVLFVLGAFDPPKIEAARGALAAAAAAVRLDPMLILESEIPDAAEAFAVKFSDILRRRRVVFGPDPFANLSIARAAQVRRVRQVLLNVLLRLRRAFALGANDARALSDVVASSAAPLRAAANTLRELAGQAALPPREALAAFVKETGVPGGDDLVARISEARDHPLGSEAAAAAVTGMIRLAEALRTAAAALREDAR